MTKIRGSSLHLLVKNEIALLPRLLEYVSPWVDEIIVVDTGSTDGTLEVARRFADRVFQIHLDHNFSVARNFGLSKVKTEWVFHLDADEWPTEILLEWLARFVNDRKSTQYEGVDVRRHNTVGGEPIGDRTFEYHTRFFRRMHRFEGCVHEKINVSDNWVERAPRMAMIEHFKSAARQERQNEFYEEWRDANC